MWLLLAFLSATLLGFYDSFKKKALHDNAVIPILFLNTVFSSLIFLPFIFLSSSTRIFEGSIFFVSQGGGGSASLHSSKEFNCLVQLDFWLFCHETFAFDNCWAD